MTETPHDSVPPDAATPDAATPGDAAPGDAAPDAGNRDTASGVGAGPAAARPEAPPPPPEMLSGMALFIRRPILAFVLNALIVIAGLAGLMGAEVRELPAVERPVITIFTYFKGAAPETVDQQLTAPIEDAAGRVPGVRSISSTSGFGSSLVMVDFDRHTNQDEAASDMRNAIARIASTLPKDADPPQIMKADANAGAVLRLALTSPTMSAPQLTRLAKDVITDRLIAVPGVADVRLYGDRDMVFRVDVDQMKLASRGLTLADLRAALANVAYDAPAGALSSNDQRIVVRTIAAVTTPQAFENLVIKGNVRLGDVATVTLGPATGSSIMRANGQTGVGMAIVGQAQSNALTISAGVRKAVARIRPMLPKGVKLFVTSDDATFINGSIHEVVRSLVLACLIVVGVIFLFLRDWRATLIPALTLPVALIGTMAAIWLVGFSVNILTLLALVLATGMVVDDAIVVLENIVRRRAEGLGPRAAAVLGTRQVFFAVIATTTTLAAVFVPLSFLPGQTGGLFREFGFTLAMSVLLSSVVALTLCPVLASRMLRPHAAEAGGRGLLPRIGAGLARAYAATLRMALAAPAVALLAAVLFGVTAVFVLPGLRHELIPREDRSVMFLAVEAPRGVSLDYTNAKVREVEDMIAPLRREGLVKSVYSLSGRGSESEGFIVLTLVPWSQRTLSQQQIAERVKKLVAPVIGVETYTIQPNSLHIRGAGRGLRFAVTGRDYAEIASAAHKLKDRLEKIPAFGRVSLDYQTNEPQLFVKLDRRRASDLGIDITGLGPALQAMLEGNKAGTVYVGGDQYDVDLVSTSDPVTTPGDLERLFVRASDGKMVPLSSFVTLSERAVSPVLQREERMRSISLSASLTPGLALGEAWARVQRLAPKVLPADTHVIPLAEAATLTATSARLPMIFGAAILVVFLVLSAQFESFLSAIIVMSTVPLGLACAVFAMLATGISLNVYSQIGLVLLVGIMAKNGILIVEFANQLRDRGESVGDAIFHASTIRLRPVVMTMVSTVLGGVPLIASSGAGAEARAALGWVMVGGLGLAALATLYVTPVAYLLLARFSRPRAHEEARLGRELAEAAARGQ